MRGTGGGEDVPWGTPGMGFPLDISWSGPASFCLWQPPGPWPTLAWAVRVGARVFGPRSPKAGGNPCQAPIPSSPLSFLHAGFLCLRSENVLVLGLGITILGVCHYTLTVKGSHLATHGALTESKGWSKVWELFFVEVRLGGVEVTAGTVWVVSFFGLVLFFFFFFPIPSFCGVCRCVERPLWVLVCVSKCAAYTTVVCVCVCVCALPPDLEMVFTPVGRELHEEWMRVHLRELAWAPLFLRGVPPCLSVALDKVEIELPPPTRTPVLATTFGASWFHSQGVKCEPRTEREREQGPDRVPALERAPL